MSRRIDMTGKTFGNLRVVKELEERRFGEIVWLCECSCGELAEVRGNYLRTGKTKSCGCLNRSIITRDLTGKKFGKLTAKRIADYKVSYSRNNVWVCKCECGNKINVITSRLLNGGTKSCGCTRIEILKSRTGVNHPNYNPDLTKEEREGRRGAAHDDWSRMVLERDDFTCGMCSKVGGKLVAHHLNSYNWDRENRYNIDNGVTMCVECHREFHSIYGYGNNTRKQFEMFLVNEKPRDYKEQLALF